MITSDLRHYKFETPTFRGDFYEVREIKKSLNGNMKKTFVLSWVSCLDESMSPFDKKQKCPGLIHVPRKPHPMGNENYSDAFSQLGAVWAIDMRERKDRTPELGKLLCKDAHGKTSGLLLRTCNSVLRSSKVIALD